MDDLDKIVSDVMAEQNERIKGVKQLPEVDKDNYWANYNGEDRIISSDEAMELVKKNKKITTQIKSGIEALDKTLNGFVGGELVVMTGETSHGKTLLAQTITHNMSNLRVPILWFSYEVDMEQLLEKFQAMSTNLDDLALFYLPAKNESNSMAWLGDRLKESKAKQIFAKVVFIDHLDYIVPFIAGYNRADVIGEAMRKLKSLAIEYSCVIFLLAHVQKITEEKAPAISSIRSSSYIGQEADTIIYVKRILDFLNEANEAEVSVLKNRRKGTIARFLMIYDNGKLRELTDEEIMQRVEEKQYKKGVI